MNKGKYNIYSKLHPQTQCSRPIQIYDSPTREIGEPSNPISSSHDHVPIKI